jgi:hypothetical protein
VGGTEAASSQTQPSGGGGRAQATPSFADRPSAPGFLPELVDVVGAGSFEQDGGQYTHLLSRGAAWLADELKGVRGRLRVHAQVAQQPGYDGYLGAEATMAGDGCERKFQHALTGEVEAWREKQLDTEILALHVHDRRRPCYRAIRGSQSSVAWVTAWPYPAVSMPPDSLCTAVAWFVGEGLSLAYCHCGARARSGGVGVGGGGGG